MLLPLEHVLLLIEVAYFVSQDNVAAVFARWGCYGATILIHTCCVHLRKILARSALYKKVDDVEIRIQKSDCIHMLYP